MDSRDRKLITSISIVVIGFLYHFYRIMNIGIDSNNERLMDIIGIVVYIIMIIAFIGIVVFGYTEKKT